MSPRFGLLPRWHSIFVAPWLVSCSSPLSPESVSQVARRPEDIYHVTIMPCYDKKLEAARDDFIFAVQRDGSDTDTGQAGPRVTEVDSVLTSGEILDLLEVRL